MSLIVSIEGEDKTGKSSLALSAEVDGSVLYLEQDIGGFERAAPRFRTEINEGRILCMQFPPPVQRKALGLDNSLLLHGVKETWEGMIQSYLDVIDRRLPFKTVVLEGGMLWSVCHRGYLQELQENVSDKTRARLIEIMYTEPNARMEALLSLARPAGINLILTHKLDDEYVETGQLDDRGKPVKSRSGKQIAKGWKHLDQWVDMAIRMERETFKDIQGVSHTVPKATIRLSGLAMELTGWEFSYRKEVARGRYEYTTESEPIWSNIMTVATALRGEGLP